MFLEHPLWCPIKSMNLVLKSRFLMDLDPTKKGCSVEKIRLELILVDVSTWRCPKRTLRILEIVWPWETRSASLFSAHTSYSLCS